MAELPEAALRAVQAVGDHAKSDYSLNPRLHAELIDDPVAARPLLGILKSGELDRIIGVYETADPEAVRRRLVYRILSKSAALASFLAVLLGSYMLLSPSFGAGDALGDRVNLAELALLFYAFVASMFVARSKPYQEWMTNRAKAETARVDLFEKALAAEDRGPAAETDLPLLSLKLEYFRRFQLNVQRNYFRARIAQMRRVVRRRQALRGVAVILIVFSFLNLVTPFFAPLSPPATLGWLTPMDLADQRYFLFFGLVGGAIEALITAWSAVDNAERNAPRFEAIGAKLDALAESELDQARRAAARNEPEAVRRFIAKAHRIMIAEHAEWLLILRLEHEADWSRGPSAATPEQGGSPETGARA